MIKPTFNTEFNMCIGTIAFVNIKALAIPDQYENTHQVTYTVAGVNKSGDPKKAKDSIWFSAGSIKGDKLTAKDANGNWVEVVKGCDVKFPFEQNGDWFNVKRGQIVVQKVVADTSKGGAGAEEKAPFNKDGVKAGHILNCTENFLGGQAYSDGDTFKATLQAFQDITGRCQDKVKEVNPTASQFDVDVTAGRAVLSASRNAVGDLNAIEKYAMNGIIANGNALALAIVKGTAPQARAQAPAPQSLPKTTQAKINPQEPSIDFDDDIPF